MVNRWKVQAHWKGTVVKDFRDELCSARLISPLEEWGGGGKGFRACLAWRKVLQTKASQRGKGPDRG